MIKMIDTPAYKSLWIEAQQWIQTNIREIAESELESEDIASKFVHVAGRAYYTNEEDYSPNNNSPLGLNSFNPSLELNLLLNRIRAADRHGYATAEIKSFEQEHKIAI